MKKRLDYGSIAPDAMKAMQGLERYVRSCGLEQSLIEMVKLRASQINGCAYCVDMHWKDARAVGETEQRLYSLSVWRETPFYSERERAAFAWTEALTLLPQNDIPDELYEHVREHFDEKEIVDLTTAIIVINGWNRFAIPFRSEPGSYQPKKVAEPVAQPE